MVNRSVPGVIRGCGLRLQGGVYLECGLSPFGTPIEHFIQDTPPPFKVDSKIGVQVWQHPKTGTYHVIDYVGKSGYPYACDMIEEGKRYGFSRHVTPTIPFELLDNDSRIILVHEKARLMNPEDFASGFNRSDQEACCAKYQRHTMRLKKTEDSEKIDSPTIHLDKPDSFSCNAYWYNAIKPNRVVAYAKDGRSRTFDFPTEIYPWQVPSVLEREARNPQAELFGGPLEWAGYVQKRRVGSVDYHIFPHPNLERPTEDWVSPKWEMGIIAILPITNISVIRADNGSHEKTFRSVRNRTSPTINVEINEA